MSRVLVVGATGRIGRAVVPALEAAGHTVVAAGRRPELLQGLGVETVVVDITDRRSYGNLPAEMEVIVHAAAARLAPSAGPDAVGTLWRTNLQGTWNLLEYAVRRRVKQLVYCSSLAVYALPQPVPIPEEGRTYPVRTPDSYYGMSKLGGELLCERFRQEGRLMCLSLRLGRIYGPGEREGSLVLEWVQRAQRGEALVVHGAGERSSDFLYLDDAVQGLVAAVNADGMGGVLNLSSGVETTWRTLAETIVEVFSPRERPAPIHYVPEGDRTRCYLEMAQARRRLGFAPRYSLRAGLAAWRAGIQAVAVEEVR